MLGIRAIHRTLVPTINIGVGRTPIDGLSEVCFLATCKCHLLAHRCQITARYLPTLILVAQFASEGLRQCARVWEAGHERFREHEANVYYASTGNRQATGKGSAGKPVAWRVLLWRVVAQGVVEGLDP